MPVFLFASAQGHGDIHVLHVVRSMHHALHQTQLREDCLPVFKNLQLGVAACGSEQCSEEVSRLFQARSIPSLSPHGMRK